MSHQELNKLQFTIAMITEFAKKYHLKQKQAFNYLKRFKGMDFMDKHYDFMHTQSFDDVIESLKDVCKHNGGALA